MASSPAGAINCFGNVGGNWRMKPVARSCPGDFFLLELTLKSCNGGAHQKEQCAVAASGSKG